MEQRSPKPRLLYTSRDMLLALAPLAVIIILLTTLAGSCKPKFLLRNNNQYVPTYDFRTSLRLSAKRVNFPVRIPKIPEKWKANSGSTFSIADNRVLLTVGFITGTGNYIQFTQTNASASQLLKYLTKPITPIFLGEDRINNIKRSKYETETEKIWIISFAKVEIGLKGKGSNEEFNFLTNQLINQRPIN